MTEETIFLTALEQATPAERAAYLDAACAGDTALRERVEALLRSHADPDSFLDRPALERQAEGGADPNRTTDLPASAETGATNDPLSAIPGPLADELFAFLAPGGAAGSLGRLDHYEVLEVIGRGGMGVVFKARDTRLQRIVAIKVLAAPLATSGTARQRFFREARAAAAVRDEHVVSIHAVSEESGSTPYLVMEFIAGVTLANRITARGALAVKEILRIGMQAAEGLASAHRQGLIHRDIKPANILLENGVERVKITDFGLARAADDASLSQSGVIAGTPLYMSPEQAAGDRELDQRSDLFSLGSVLYTLCTGRAAFAAGSTVAVLKRVCEETPRPIRECNPDIPDWLEAVVNKLLAKAPGERFQSAAEVAELLGQHLAQMQQSRLTPPAPPERPGAVPPAAAQAGPGGQAARKRKRLVVAAVLLGLVGVAAGLATIAALLPPKPVSPSPNLPPDPRVLTVSQKPEDGGRYRTIKEALDEVEPEMTIRVLDDAVYEERLLINRPEQHRGVVLEATGKATIRRPSGKTDVVWIRGVPGVTLRGFRFTSSPGDHGQIHISGSCPGVILDNLDMMATSEFGKCVNLRDVPLPVKDAPIVIQNCVMRDSRHAVVVGGRYLDNDNINHPLPTGYVVIRNNTMENCNSAVVLAGASYSAHVLGNRIRDSQWAAIEFEDFLPGAADILVANNTLFRNDAALRVWHEHGKGKEFLKCKNVRFQNNLVLEPPSEADMVVLDHTRGDAQQIQQIRPGDVDVLLKCPEWRFSHNWREIDPMKVAIRLPGWLPRCPDDHLVTPIKILSRKPGDPDFLRPPKDSPLAKGGAGVNDISLPAYVGAVPPEGVQPWDWQKTWDIQCRRLLTVSKDPAAGGHFRTITEALDKVEPEMTIRVLDDAVYEEFLQVNRPEQHRGVILEAAGNAAIRRLADKSEAIQIRGVPGFTLRGFRFAGTPDKDAQVFIDGACPGVVLDRLDMTAGGHTCVNLYDVLLSDKDAPIVIQNCTMRGHDGVLIEGRDRENFDRPRPCGHVVIRNNTLVGCDGPVTLCGAVHKVHVVGNRILESRYGFIYLLDLLEGSADILVANNTMLRCETALRILDDHSKGRDFLKCKNIRVQNNLVFKTHSPADMVFSNHRRGTWNDISPCDLSALLKSPQWRFSCNCREIDLKRADRERERWIPLSPTDQPMPPNAVLSYKPGDPDFLRPPKDSPLAWSGAGGVGVPSSRIASAVGQAASPANTWMAAWAVAQTRNQPDRSLPAYVGAVPPDGVEPWNWDKTWRALTH